MEQIQTVLDSGALPSLVELASSQPADPAGTLKRRGRTYEEVPCVFADSGNNAQACLKGSSEIFYSFC